jgi:predicted HTH transcriptional regulator
MLIGVETIRELLARTEGEALDFKRCQYPSTPAGNAEMTKDIMAMANVLSPNAPPGYILIGVDQESDQTGRAVGVDPSTHLDDASVQQKIGSLLNRTPKVSYFPIQVDELSIGVLQIYPGGRPYYPIKQQGNDQI